MIFILGPLPYFFSAHLTLLLYGYQLQKFPGESIILLIQAYLVILLFTSLKFPLEVVSFVAKYGMILYCEIITWNSN
jgi:hypothetical protein